MLEMAENAAMEHLYRGPLTCAVLGGLLWYGKHPGAYGNCSCPFARPAGRVLRGLQKRGLVDTVPYKSGEPRTLWTLTRQGRHSLQKRRAK